MSDAEQIAAAVLDHMTDAVLVFDAGRQTVRDVNRAFEQLTELPKTQLVGRTFGEVVVAAERGQLVAKEWTGQKLLVKTARGSVSTLSTLVPLRDARGVVSGHLVLLKPEPQLARHQRHLHRLAHLGERALAFVHDFNNLLAVLETNVTLLLSERHGPGARELLEEVRLVVRRASSLAGGLLAMGGKERGLRHPVDLDAAVTQALQVLRRLLGHQFELRSSLHSNRRVLVDAGVLEQVLLNLVTNARDAMPAGGIITITTDCVTLDRPGAKYFARLTVRDTGSGMTSETLKNIFEPFFTTKAPGKGTGLGLPTARALVEEHHGWLEVDSVPGVGSTFRVLLPVEAA